MRWLAPLLLCSTSLLSFASDPIDVIIVSGQSNAVGFDAPPSQLSADPIDAKIAFWWRCGDPPPDEHDSTSHGWTTLKAQPLGNPIRPRRDRQYGNFAQAKGGFGPEIGMARMLSRSRARPLAIIKVAFSGTHVAGDWNPQFSDNDSSADSQDLRGACYRSLVSEVRQALKTLSETRSPRVIAIAWVQGESDANPSRVNDYQQNITRMITSLRNDLQTPDLIALVGVNTKFGGGRNKHLPGVIAAQQAFAMSDPNAAYVDTTGATIANDAHFDAAGTIEVGKRFARALSSLQSKE